MDDVETTLVVLAVGNSTHTTQVTATGDHDKLTVLELNKLGDLASGEIDLDGIVDLDKRVGVADGAAIVGNQVGDALLAGLNAANLAKLVGSLLISDAVDGETALDVVDETEVLTSLGQGDDVHESSGEGAVGADLAVDQDLALHEDGGDLTTVHGVLQTVAQKDDQRERLAQLVGTRGAAGSVGASELVKHPVVRRGSALHVLLLTTNSHVCLVMEISLRPMYL